MLAQRGSTVHARHMQRQRHMQALGIDGHHLSAHFQRRAELDFAQVMDMRLQREQRMRQGFAPGGVQADAVHQTVHAVAEQQGIKRIAQMAVVVHPLGQDHALKTDQRQRRAARL